MIKQSNNKPNGFVSKNLIYVDRTLLNIRLCKFLAACKQT